MTVVAPRVPRRFKDERIARQMIRDNEALLFEPNEDEPWVIVPDELREQFGLPRKPLANKAREQGTESILAPKGTPMKIPHDQWPKGPNGGTKFVRTAYDPGCRELALALAKVCRATGNYDGARILDRVAHHEYNLMTAIRRTA